MSYLPCRELDTGRLYSFWAEDCTVCIVSLPKPAPPRKPIASQLVDGNPLSAATSWASLLWSYLGNQKWKGQALPHLTQACLA